MHSAFWTSPIPYLAEPLWLSSYLIGVMFGFGAIFNFNAGVGDVKRAPQWMSNLRLEWLHRAFEQPQKNVPRYWNFIKTLLRLIREERKKVAAGL